MLMGYLLFTGRKSHDRSTDQNENDTTFTACVWPMKLDIEERVKGCRIYESTKKTSNLKILSWSYYTKIQTK